MTPLARIIDANLNRAREALRTLEDLARFVLDDEAMCARLKRARHGLVEAAEMLPIDRAALLAWRDTPGDVGTRVSVPREYQRTTAGDIAAAAFGRLQEALRSMEECGKAMSEGVVAGLGASAGVSAEGDDREPTLVGRGHGGALKAAAAFESIRYESYEIERLLLQRLSAGRPGQWTLCVLLTTSMCAHHSLPRVAELCIEGGASALQVREKDMDAREFLSVIRRVMEIARPLGVPVIVNDRADLAMLAGAAGVHVGQSDLSVRDVRRLAGASLLVGVSTTNPEQARRAAANGADYCGVGPMFATTTKVRAPAGVAYLREYLGETACRGVPHLAIGGISPDNVGELVEAGCRGVAVSGGVCRSSDPRGVCERLVAALQR